MKFPEYNNHRSNEPLYASRQEGPKGNVKYPLMFFGLPILTIACAAGFLLALYLAFH